MGFPFRHVNWVGRTKRVGREEVSGEIFDMMSPLILPLFCFLLLLTLILTGGTADKSAFERRFCVKASLIPGITSGWHRRSLSSVFVPAALRKQVSKQSIRWFFPDLF